MTSRRDFLRATTLLAGGAFAGDAFSGGFPSAIARAMEIDPAPGTTFHDAEHVVVLMQENRSFDHAFGALRGVRGFRDPRAHVLPNGNPVWCQTDAKGDTYTPFRLDINRSNATWIGGLPHTWPDQIDALNGGRHDNWLIAKAHRDLPFTLGHYTRADIPFYYALADAFTVCDQAFCSSLTGTTANRLFLWSGAIRARNGDVGRVLNADTYYDKEADWQAFPERLEAAGVSWRLYQNEISFDTGFHGDEAPWLGGFTDNPIEWFPAFNVRFAASRRAYLPTFIAEAPARIAEKEKALGAPGISTAVRDRTRRELAALRDAFAAAVPERAAYTDAAWNALSARAKSLHARAFTTNAGDRDYRSLATLDYHDGTTARTTPVPRGDVLYQFRQDVERGALPAVSWLVAPENFSDHPSAPWYGAWYVSEVLDILTKNPEVWKKTVFILCYDENDGYFDHVPPFVAPHPSRPETGTTSPGIDTAAERTNAHGREHAIGLGFRVPLVVASPWSRGGCVNSQIFDHTSVILFLERWLGGRGTTVKEPNIGAWRRTVCGDLTSVFRPYEGTPLPAPAPLDRDTTVERIHAAKFRAAPVSPAPLSATDIGAATIAHMKSLQEAGTRPSCPLPYELVVNGGTAADGFRVSLEARAHAFPKTAQGAAFTVVSYEPAFVSRAYAVRAGDVVRDSLPIADRYHIRVDGPNGFTREFTGTSARREHDVHVVVDHLDGRAASGVLDIRVTNRDTSARDISLHDESYGARAVARTVGAGKTISLHWPTTAGHGWYDFTVRSGDVMFRFAGRVETGAWSVSDPAMGRA